MQARPLGKSGLSVQPLALGGNVFGWSLDEAASVRVLDAFIDAGLDLIDTADVYPAWVPGNQGGESEAIIGRWLKQPATTSFSQRPASLWRVRSRIVSTDSLRAESMKPQVLTTMTDASPGSSTWV